MIEGRDMICHHPSEFSLLRCAAGTLPAPHASVVIAHAARCAECAVALSEAAEIGGALLDAAPAGALSVGALPRVLERLGGAGRDPVPLPLSLAALTGRWRWIGPGIAMIKLIERDASNSRLDLIRVAPGTALLEHGHGGLETTCVLAGGFDDGGGAFHAGDFIETESADAHRPTALAGEDCICLIATTGHLQARGVLGWLVRPLLGM